MVPDTCSDDWRPSADDGPILLIVDGETFRVRVRPDGGSDYSWVSGPNPGYGFSSGPVRVAWPQNA